MKTQKFIALILLLIVFNSCNLTKALYYFNTTKITIKERDFKEKKVLFTEIHHAGRKVFYQKLADTLAYYKKNGFVIYYEGVKHKGSDYDSLESDIIKRKFRKMVGILATREMYNQINNLSKFRGQPPYDSLSIDDNDINTDVSIKDLITEYEKNNGEVILTAADTVALDAEYNGKMMKGVNHVILDYRNKYLAKEIYLSKHQNIIVLYGIGHRKGFFEELKSLYVD